MISVTVFKDEERYRGIRLSGHSGYADAGSDIVCAAVSALAINALNSIEAFTEDTFEEEVREEDAFIEFHLIGDFSAKSELLMLSLLLGLQSIAQENNEFITLTTEEV